MKSIKIMLAVLFLSTVSFTLLAETKEEAEQRAALVCKNIQGLTFRGHHLGEVYKKGKFTYEDGCKVYMLPASAGIPRLDLTTNKNDKVVKMWMLCIDDDNLRPDKATIAGNIRSLVKNVPGIMFEDFVCIDKKWNRLEYVAVYGDCVISIIHMLYEKHNVMLNAITVAYPYVK